MSKGLGKALFRVEAAPVSLVSIDLKDANLASKVRPAGERSSRAYAPTAAFLPQLLEAQCVIASARRAQIEQITSLLDYSLSLEMTPILGITDLLGRSVFFRFAPGLACQGVVRETEWSKKQAHVFWGDDENESTWVSFDKLEAYNSITFPKSF